jgi:hypothetical protein
MTRSLSLMSVYEVDWQPPARSSPPSWKLGVAVGRGGWEMGPEGMTVMTDLRVLVWFKGTGNKGAHWRSTLTEVLEGVSPSKLTRMSRRTYGCGIWVMTLLGGVGQEVWNQDRS